MQKFGRAKRDRTADLYSASANYNSHKSLKTTDYNTIFVRKLPVIAPKCLVLPAPDISTIRIIFPLVGVMQPSSDNRIAFIWSHSHLLLGVFSLLTLILAFLLVTK